MKAGRMTDLYCNVLKCTLIITFQWALVVAIVNGVATSTKPSMGITKGINHIGEGFAHTNTERL